MQIRMFTETRQLNYRSLYYRFVDVLAMTVVTANCMEIQKKIECYSHDATNIRQAVNITETIQ